MACLTQRAVNNSAGMFNLGQHIQTAAVRITYRQSSKHWREVVTCPGAGTFSLEPGRVLLSAVHVFQEGMGR